MKNQIIAKLILFLSFLLINQNIALGQEKEKKIKELTSYYKDVEKFNKDYKFKQSISLLNEAKNYYNNKELHNKIGLIKLHIRDYQGAILDFTNAIKLDSTYSVAYSNRGVAREKVRNFNQALEDYNIALNLDPKNSINYSNRASIKIENKDYEDAILDYDRALVYGEKEEIIYSNRGYCKIKIGKYKSAIIDYTQANILNPNNAITLSNRAEAFYFNGEYMKAISDGQKSLEIDKTNKKTWYYLGLSFIKFKRKKDGCEYLRISEKLKYEKAKETIINLCNN